MKKSLIIAAAFAIASSGYAQKDELKTLRRIYDKTAASAKDIQKYRETLVQAEPLMANASEADRVYFNYYKAMSPLLAMELPENQKNPDALRDLLDIKTVKSIAAASEAVVKYEQTSGKKQYTDDVQQNAKRFSQPLLNRAIALGKEQKFAESSEILHALYLVDKTNLDNLYYAASYAVNAKEYDKALEYYNTLIAQNYTGEKTLYTAKSKLSDSYETFASKADRDNAVKLGTHEAPKDEKEPSKKGEIYKNTSLILINQGKIEEAQKAVSQARKENPNDTAIMLAEADLYLKLKDNASYSRVVNEILAKEPNNADLIYNLGVLAIDANKLDEATAKFNRVLEINPNYANAYVNLAAVKLRADEVLVEKINNLSPSAADNKKYEQLRAERISLFNSVLPLLEKAHSLDPKNDVVMDNLLSVYGFLEMRDKRKALRAKTGR